MTVPSDERSASLAYVAATRIPGIAANGFQVMKMAQALVGLVPNTMLIAAHGHGEVSVSALMSRYGVERLPPLHLLHAPTRFGAHLFAFQAALLALRRRSRLVLSRSIGVAALSARLGVPTIWECHAPPQGFELRYWSSVVGARGLRRVVVISNALRQLMEQRHPAVKDMDVVVAHDGVDLARFATVPSPEAAKLAAGRDPTRSVAGYAGHLYEGRGVEVILACAKALPNWTFLIAGGTPDAVAAVTQTCRELALQNVELLGFVENAELPARLAVSDVLMMPYQRRVMVSGGRLDTAQWMSPLKMFEYMAMGRAIVASDLPVLREVLDDTCSMLVPPDRPAEWIAALERGANDQALWQGLSDAARQRVKTYDWSLRVRRMLDGIAAPRVQAA